MTQIFRLLLLVFLLPAAALAQSDDDPVQADLLPGWRLPDGSHMAALHLRLAPGWKTYWRAPGDAGIPPEFNWTTARNVKNVAVHWPAPKVFHQSGMRSVGYKGDVVLPLRVTLDKPGQDVQLSGVVDLGICKDICLPHRVRIKATLPANAKRPDPIIAAALADQPLTAKEAGIGAVRCRVSPDDGGLSLTADVPVKGGNWDAVIESRDPAVWVAEPTTSRSGGMLRAQTRLHHVDGGAFALDRSGLRFTLLGKHMAIDIQGCKG